tara:strand:- start:16489 stop:18243 length:1755 start_codon:yes stop_codon:yes gene_type:complete
MKELLILERSQSNLNLKEDSDGSIFLEGIFTEIGVKNENERVYEEAEILPHIKELQEFVKSQKLLGELDHPKDFDISLANVSHVIEELNYNPSKKQVIGKIRLLNTSKGKEAQALVKDGIPLHISSRAAGSVRENGTVKINKMFTYDLVARPGFANAELNRVNESYGFKNNDSLFIYEMGAIQQTPVNKKNNKYNSMDTSKFISKEDFQKYSEYLNVELSKIKESASQNSNSKSLQNVINYAEHIAEKVNQLTDFSNYLAENTNKSISYSEYIAENLNLVKEFSNYIAGELNNSITYSEHVAEMADSGLEFSNYIAKKLNDSIQYSEHLAENLDASIQYGEHVAEKLDSSIQYSEDVAKTLDTSIQYTEGIAETVDKHISYSNYVTESLNGVTPTSSEKVNDYKESITEKLSTILENAKGARVGKSYGFLSLLNEERKNNFDLLSSEKQSLVIENMNKGIVMSTSQANNIFDSITSEKKSELNPFNNMPEKFKRKWEVLSESRRREIVAEANLFPTLNTPYKIMNFWQTRDMRSSRIKMESLNENNSNHAGANVKTEVKDINESFITEDAAQALINKVKFNLNR